MQIIDSTNMSQTQLNALNRLIEIQRENEAKREQMRLRNSYEFINAKLSRRERQRCNLNRSSNFFKSKTSQHNCTTRSY